MAANENVTKILNGTIQAIKSIIPHAIEVQKPALLANSFTTSTHGVLIGMTGDVRGQLMIHGEEQIFGSIGELMFGMPLEGEMLDSFTGELGNMIAGNLSTAVSEQNLFMDITPPTVMRGESRMSGFDRALHVPVVLKSRTLNIILMLQTA